MAKKLVLKSFDTFNTCKTIKNFEYFNVYIDFYVGFEDDEKHCDFFKLQVISYSWLDKKIDLGDTGIYIKHCLVLKYFDEKIIRQHVERLVNRANKEGTEKALNCLYYYFEGDAEEWRY